MSPGDFDTRCVMPVTRGTASICVPPFVYSPRSSTCSFVPIVAYMSFGCGGHASEGYAPTEGVLGGTLMSVQQLLMTFPEILTIENKKKDLLS